MLLTQYAIDEDTFHGGLETMSLPNPKKTTWANSTIRARLNGEFYNSTFTDAEKKAIILSTISNDASENTPQNAYLAERPTQDHVFLLSFGDAERYLGAYPSSPLRMAKQTPYCRAWGNEFDPYWRDPWWLRSMTEGGSGALIIDNTGKYAFQDIWCFEVALRPAMWVDTTKL